MLSAFSGPLLGKVIELSGVLKIEGCFKKNVSKKEKTYLENMSTHNVDLTASRSFNHHCLCSYTVLFYSF